MQVRERRGMRGVRPGGAGNGGNRGNKAEAKRLTVRIREAKSADELVNVLEETVDGPIFDYVLASVSYHRLAMWNRRGELLSGEKTKLLLDRLNRRVKGMAAEAELNPQACANVLWSIAHLSDALINALDVVPAIAAQIPLKAKDTNPQELSNILWASANLKDDAPDVLSIVPAMAAQIPLKAKDMNPQELSNILWASANLKDDAPDVLSIVPAMAAQIPLKTKDMNPQDLSNNLWASANLKDDAPDVLSIVPAMAAQIPLKAKDMIPQHLSNILWASANLKDDAPDVLSIVPAIAAQIPLKAKDMIPQGLSNILWASANLKDDAPDVLSIVPAIAAQMPLKAKDMIPQGLSNILWASTNLKDDAPDVLSIVPAIAAQIPLTAKDLDAQELSNILWASANLKGDAPDVLSIVPAIAAQIPFKAKEMDMRGLSNSLIALLHLQEVVPEARYLLGISGGSADFLRLVISRTQKLIPNMSKKDMVLALPAILWASARSKPSVPEVRELLGSAAESLGSKTQLSKLTAWGLCALHESYKVLDVLQEFGSFEEKLKTEITRRGLSPSDVERSFEGPLQWGRGKRWKVLPQRKRLMCVAGPWTWPMTDLALVQNAWREKEFNDSWCLNFKEFSINFIQFAWFVGAYWWLRNLMIPGLGIHDWHDGLDLVFLAPFSRNLWWLTMGPCGIVQSFLVPTPSEYYDLIPNLFFSKPSMVCCRISWGSMTWFDANLDSCGEQSARSLRKVRWDDLPLLFGIDVFFVSFQCSINRGVQQKQGFPPSSSNHPLLGMTRILRCWTPCARVGSATTRSGQLARLGRGAEGGILIFSMDGVVVFPMFFCHVQIPVALQNRGGDLFFSIP